MSIALKVISNCDDVHLFWKTDADIPDCLGFALYRKRNGGAVEVLRNRVGFEIDAEDNSSPQPSTIWPFQRLDWTDHGGNTGDTLSYKVVAMTGRPGALSAGPSSRWSRPRTLTPDCGNGISAYFNRGMVLSQFMSRLMRQRGWSARDIRKHAGMVNHSLRQFLSGDLRVALLKALDEACTDMSIEVYAALFELSDEELAVKLEYIGPRLHIVLGNGAVKSRTEDENAAIRARLLSAGAQVHDRMSAPTFLAHNKFMVLCRYGKPFKVLTGSTNWQPTGLCTQVNNLIAVENAGIAADYLAAWERLKVAGNGHPREFKAANSETPLTRKLGRKASAFARFTATRNWVDLDELCDLIDNAEESILFEMFMPGATVFNKVLEKRESLYVRGVANTIPKQAVDETAVNVSLVNTSRKEDFGLAVVQPEGIKNAFAYWAAEVTRRQFSAIGHSIVHSKLLVIDVGAAEPIVITGSHNFSNSASRNNDENYLVIRGNRALAQAYAVNCLAIYDHYRWRKYVADTIAQGRKPWSHLDARDGWLSRYASSPNRQAMLEFWFNQ